MFVMWVIIGIVVSLLLSWLLFVSFFQYLVKLAVRTAIDELRKLSSDDVSDPFDEGYNDKY